MEDGPGTAAPQGAADLGRVWTIPNVVSFVRLACVPVFLWVLFPKHDRLGAAVLLAVLGATDWIDGVLARRLGQVSTLGKVLDPVADRILVGVAVVAIIIDGSVMLWFGILVIVREALVSVGVLWLAARKAPRIDVLWIGKAGTFGLMAAFPLFLVANSGVSWHEAAEVAAWFAAIPALILSWGAALRYLPIARSALAEGRRGVGVGSRG